MTTFILFLLLGAVIGSFGTLIGVGGGFVLLPVLLWLYPNEPPEILAGISLAVIFFNALSGSIAYGRQKRIQYKSGFIFAAAALPGTILGALATQLIPRRWFDFVIGSLLVAASVVLLFRPTQESVKLHDVHGRGMKVSLIDSKGVSYTFSYSLWLGLALSFVVGFISSILGIGGGIIHVPALVYLLNFPVHIATATSHFILALMTFSGSMTHFIAGHLAAGFGRIIPLAIGVIIGAQIGARVSIRLHGTHIIRALAFALLLVGLRTLWRLWM